MMGLSRMGYSLRQRLLPTPDDIRLLMEHSLDNEEEVKEYEEFADDLEDSEDFSEVEWLYARRIRGSRRADILKLMHA